MFPTEYVGKHEPNEQSHHVKKEDSKNLETLVVDRFVASTMVEDE